MLGYQVCAVFAGRKPNLKCAHHLGEEDLCLQERERLARAAKWAYDKGYEGALVEHQLRRRGPALRHPNVGRGEVAGVVMDGEGRDGDHGVRG